jgi:hypothetical protein
VREARFDLDRHATVDAAGAGVDRREDLGRGGDVIRGDLEDRIGDRGAGLRQRGDLLVVGVALGERAREDRRVGRDADDVAFGDESLEVSRRDAFAREVVEPDADAERGELLGGGGMGDTSQLAAASDSFAAATTASVVIPNSRYRVL